jgi:sensor histidine kinase YesM
MFFSKSCSSGASQPDLSADYSPAYALNITPAVMFKTTALTIVFSTLIAIFLDIFAAFDSPFRVTFIISQCIGLSINLTFKLLFSLAYKLQPKLFYPRWLLPRFFLLLSAIVLGSFVGIILSNLLVGEALTTDGRYSQILLLGIFFGVIIVYFFISWTQMTRMKQQFQEERLIREKYEKQVAQTQLRLLQAQIEPHFLFNTLSTVLSLLETDASTSKLMLEDLIHYLRTSLATSRKEIVTLAEEADMIRAYLMIFKVRMGERLWFTIDLPEQLKAEPFAPMLIQPLVENAIKHGLEPKVEGGQISLRFDKIDGVLKVQVSDSGLGMDEQAENGVGLENIRERLGTLYGEDARLTLEEVKPSGLTATIEVPCD